MARPSRIPILSAAQSWDATINDNLIQVFDQPLALVRVANYAALVSGFDPADFEDCVAVTADHKFWISDGMDWVELAGGASSSRKGCQSTNVADQAVNNVSLTLLTWDTDVYDTNSYHSTSSNQSRFLCPTGEAGKFRMDCSLAWDASGSGLREVYFRRYNASNTLLETIVQDAVPISGAAFHWAVSMPWIMADNDYVTVAVYQDSGGTRQIQGTSTTVDNRSRVTWTRESD